MMYTNISLNQWKRYWLIITFQCDLHFVPKRKNMDSPFAYSRHVQTKDTMQSWSNQFNYDSLQRGYKAGTREAGVGAGLPLIICISDTRWTARSRLIIIVLWCNNHRNHFCATITQVIFIKASFRGIKQVAYLVGTDKWNQTQYENAAFIKIQTKKITQISGSICW